MRKASKSTVRLGILLMACLPFLPGGLSQSSARPVSPNVMRQELENGMSLILVHDARWPLVSLDLMIKPGALADPVGSAGLSTLTAATLMEGNLAGTSTLLRDQFDFLGTDVSVRSTWENTSIHSEFVAEFLPAMLEAVASGLTRPVFSEETVARARQSLLSGIRTELTNNLEYASLEFVRLLFAGDRLGYPKQGSPKSLKKITPAQIQQFYETHYGADALTLVIAGNADFEAVKSAAQKTLGAMKRKNAANRAPAAESYTFPKRIPGREIWLVERDISQPQIRIGHIVAAADEAEQMALALMNHIFGGAVNSRLMKIFREQRAMTYGISSEYPAKEPLSPFLIWTFTETAKARDMVQGLTQEVERIHSEPVTADELDNAKKAMRNRFVYSFETAPALASHAFNSPGKSFDQIRSDYLRKLENTSREQIMSVARKYLLPGDLKVLFVGREKELKPILDAMGGYKVYAAELVPE